MESHGNVVFGGDGYSSVMAIVKRGKKRRTEKYSLLLPEAITLFQRLSP